LYPGSSPNHRARCMSLMLVSRTTLAPPLRDHREAHKGERGVEVGGAPQCAEDRLKVFDRALPHIAVARSGDEIHPAQRGRPRQLQQRPGSLRGGHDRTQEYSLDKRFSKHRRTTANARRSALDQLVKVRILLRQLPILPAEADFIQPDPMSTNNLSSDLHRPT
jgi:hypothetical protein